ncbi:hypothetical protein D3C81_1818260 [compost metagenome]
MGVAVHQRAHTILLHDPGDFFRGHVDDIVGFHPGLRAAFAAQLAGQALACGPWQVPQNPQGDGVAQVAAQAHVGFIAGAQAVAMHQ